MLVNRYVYTEYRVAAFDYTITFALISGVFAALSLRVYRFNKERFTITSRSILPLVIIGILGGLAMGLIVFGQNYTTAINTAILFTATIITTSIFSHFLLKETYTSRQIFWLVTMFIGLYLAIVGLHVIKLSAGDLIILSAAVIFGFTNTYSKVAMKTYKSNIVGDVRLTISGVLLLTIGLVVNLGNIDFIVTSAGWWPVIAGLLFWLSIRYFYGAVHYISANKAIVLNNSQLVLSTIFGILLLNESYDAIKFIGCAVVLVSIYFINKK